MKTKLKLMHTLGGMPAMYYPGMQICYGMTRSKKQAITLADNYSQILKERKASDRWRRQQGFSNTDKSFGFVYVRVQA